MLIQAKSTGRGDGVRHARRVTETALDSVLRVLGVQLHVVDEIATTGVRLAAARAGGAPEEEIQWLLARLDDR